MELNKEQQELWAVVQKINECWYKGQASQLGDFFHHIVVFNSPDFRHQISGKDNCTQTYVDFLKISKVLLYNENNHTVQLFDNTAIVTYDFEMKYEQNNKTYHEVRTDIMVLILFQGSWRLAWRGLSNLKDAGREKNTALVSINLNSELLFRS